MEGDGWGIGQMGGRDQEGICWDEHWMLYTTEGSLTSTPETNIALCVNYLKLKKKKKKKWKTLN